MNVIVGISYGSSRHMLIEKTIATRVWRQHNAPLAQKAARHARMMVMAAAKAKMT